VATLSFDPAGLVVDSSGNVYTANMGNGFPLMTAGVYKITLAAPTPTPNSNSSSATTTTTPTGKPTPGPALKVTDIPAEITLDLGSSTGGTIPADQPIVAEVPCTAPEGQLLDRCTVNVTAPEYVLLGQGDGISVRSTKKVSIGKATVKSTGGKKTIVVKVKINPKGRKALQRNLKITATVGLTAITVSNLKSTGEANTTMRLPTQLVSPEAGIFDSNSVSLNKAGVAFVNRLAKLLPSKPKNMVFIGFADNTGVPGDNRWLGDRRAKAVRDALAAKGVEPVKSSIETKAARSPRDDNAKQSGRERNRRVSIRITY
jgi:outer membrane protein OmpA-like peptidoglycan-associated protein